MNPLLQTNSVAGVFGTLDMAVMQECPNAQYNGLTLEYGTLPGPLVLKALRAEQWLQRTPQASPEQRRQIKQQMLEAFYVQTPQWQRQVLEQSRQVCRQTVAGLMGD